jgi:DNA-binding phage protein
MLKTFFVSIFSLLLLLLIYFSFNFYFLKQSSIPKNTLLEEKGNFCLGVAEKAVANRQAIVEFQKYEILGDKAMVMRKCMEENGFEENPNWLNENLKVVQATRKSNEISEDAAMENLKREAIYRFVNSNDQPLYWRTKQIK